MSIKEDPAGFARVDRTTDPNLFIEFLDSHRTIEGEREIKELVRELLSLRAGTHVLDIGCGTGDDAREIAALVGSVGRVVGIDQSEMMVPRRSGGRQNRSRSWGCAPATRARSISPMDRSTEYEL